MHIDVATITLKPGLPARVITMVQALIHWDLKLCANDIHHSSAGLKIKSAWYSPDCINTVKGFNNSIDQSAPPPPHFLVFSVTPLPFEMTARIAHSNAAGGIKGMNQLLLIPSI